MNFVVACAPNEVHTGIQRLSLGEVAFIIDSSPLDSPRAAPARYSPSFLGIPADTSFAERSSSWRIVYEIHLQKIN